MNMTTSEQRIAIAEWMGWKWWKHTKSDTFLFCEPNVSKATLDDGVMKWECCKHPEEVSFVSLTAVPNYPEDLNACAEFEGSIQTNFNLWRSYGINLLEVVGYSSATPPTTWNALADVAHATAPQRTEAFCRMQWPERWQGGRE